MHTRHDSRLVVGIFALLCVLAMEPLHAQAGSAALSAGGEVAAGADFPAQLQLDLGSQTFGSADFAIDWDPAVLAVDLSYGASGVAAVPGVSVGLDQAAGSLRIAADAVSASLSGAVTLLTIGFTAIGSTGASTMLDLSVEDLRDQLGLPIPVLGILPRPGAGALIAIIEGVLGTCGDADADVDIDILDALFTAQFAAGLRAADPADPEGTLRADVDASGSVTVLDSLLIAQFAAGLSATFACPGLTLPELPPLPDPDLQVGDIDLVHSAHVAAGGDLSVQVFVDAGAQDLGAYAITINFDAAELQAASVEASGGAAAGPTSVLIDNIAGTVSIGSTGIDVAGSAALELATIHFDAAGAAGESTMLGATVERLVDELGQDIGAATPRAMASAEGVITIQ